MTSNRFRARADKCFSAANSMADPERKLAHLDLAQRWLRLAIQMCSAFTLSTAWRRSCT